MNRERPDLRVSYHTSRVVGAGIMFSTARSSVHSCVRPFVCYKTCEHGILKTSEPILMPMALVAQRVWDNQLWGSGQEVKGQGHTKLNIDLEAWRRRHSRSPWVELCFLVHNYKKPTSSWDRRTLRGNCKYRLNHAMVVNVYHPYIQFHGNVRLPYRRIVTFSIIVLYK